MKQREKELKKEGERECPSLTKRESNNLCYHYKARKEPSDNDGVFPDESDCDSKHHPNGYGNEDDVLGMSKKRPPRGSRKITSV